jgi:hypothetical protein
VEIRYKLRGAKPSKGGKKMKKVLGALALTALFAVPASAGVLGKCQGCHNGSYAPTVEQMKANYKTAKEFVKAAKKKLGKMGNIPIQEIKAAAKELYK